jgi:hypothetical protein
VFICGCNIHLFVKLGNRMLQEEVFTKVVLCVRLNQATGRIRGDLRAENSKTAVTKL